MESTLAKLDTFITTVLLFTLLIYYCITVVYCNIAALYTSAKKLRAMNWVILKILTTKFDLYFSIYEFCLTTYVRACVLGCVRECVWRSRDAFHLARASTIRSRQPAKVLSLIVVAQPHIVCGLIVMRNVRERAPPLLRSTVAATARARASHVASVTRPFTIIRGARK